jgi:hypothetical protein
VDQPQASPRRSIFKLFSYAEKSPEEILLQTIAATAILLVGAALFDHTPLPLVPAAILILGWRAYHVRRTTS